MGSTGRSLPGLAQKCVAFLFVTASSFELSAFKEAFFVVIAPLDWYFLALSVIGLGLVGSTYPLGSALQHYATEGLHFARTIGFV